ncbi:NADH dehydrogenase (ubiquinone) MLRQ subunit [Oratosquilla oratoria]|uniref:NADH dehydrogenase (ubiquinone) MLRQ subunit n=1 Tax=Oratosquilla oratoria TaxID=337810 RepID=UPI003F77040A
MQGLSFASLKRHPALIPLYVCVGAGVVASGLYTFRLAAKNPDVSWNRSSNPEPNQAYAGKQYKFYSPIRDYSTLKSPAPNYEADEE